MTKAVIGFVVGSLLLGFVALWFALYGGVSDRTDCPVREQVLIVVPKGSGVAQIASQLQSAGVIDGTSRFGLRVRLEGVSAKMHAGPIRFCRNAGYGGAIEVLTRGGNATAIVTVPEGPAREEVAALVRESGVTGSYMAASASSRLLDPRSYGAPLGSGLEGFLFPSTYDLPLKPTAAQLVAAQLRAFKREFATVDMARARKANLTPFDVVVIASMVERETSAAKERPMVSAVIWNRLKQGSPLGIDATTRYQYRNWQRPIRASELASDSPWNTRKRAGLPPGPIGNPGIASLRAAANPARSSAMYYVVKPWACGEHTFATTAAEFERAVAAYNSARQSNGGKAPTKCD